MVRPQRLVFARRNDNTVTLTHTDLPTYNTNHDENNTT